MPDWRSIRLIRDEFGQIAPDVTGRLGGSAVWVLANREKISAEIAAGAFATKLSTAFDAPVIAPRAGEAFCELCDRAFRRQIKRLIGLEQRAGRLVVGVEAAQQALKSGRADWAVLAINAAPNSVRLIEKQICGRQTAAIFQLLEMQEIGEALGRDLVGCVAFNRSRIVTRLPEELLRLTAFRGKALPGSDGPQIQNVTVPIEERNG